MQPILKVSFFSHVCNKRKPLLHFSVFYCLICCFLTHHLYWMYVIIYFCTLFKDLTHLNKSFLLCLKYLWFVLGAKGEWKGHFAKVLYACLSNSQTRFFPAPRQLGCLSIINNNLGSHPGMLVWYLSGRRLVCLHHRTYDSQHRVSSLLLLQRRKTTEKPGWGKR